MKVPKSEIGWRADIDGLRAIAVLAVVVHHAAPAILPGGFIGVDVFFVISGYLITSLLLREHASGRFSLIRFYERRARRLFPALAVVLACTMVATFLFARPAQISESGRLGVAAALSVANVSLWRGAGYFDASSHLKPFLHLWSLGVEEQFYLVWPLLLAVLLRVRAIVFLVMIGILSCMLVTEALNETHPNAVFYLPFFRAWELGIGALAAIVEHRHRASGPLMKPTGTERTVLLGIGLIGISAVRLTPATPFPGLSALPAVAGTALVIWACGRQSSPRGLTTRLLTSRPMVFFGMISYALYLWHWPLLVVPAAAGFELNLSKRLLLMVVAVGVSALTLKWIETPFRTSSAPARAAVLACGALLAAGGLVVALYAIERHSARSPERVALASALSWPSHETARSSCPATAASLWPIVALRETPRPMRWSGATVMPIISILESSSWIRNGTGCCWGTCLVHLCTELTCLPTNRTVARDRRRLCSGSKSRRPYHWWSLDFSATTQIRRIARRIISAGGSGRLEFASTASLTLFGSRSLWSAGLIPPLGDSLTLASALYW